MNDIVKVQRAEVVIPGHGSVEVAQVLERDRPTMRESDAATILAAAAAIDNRNVTELQIQEWAFSLAGLFAEECLTAVRRFRQDNPDRYLTPGGVRDQVMALRRERARDARIAKWRAEVAAFDAEPEPEMPEEGHKTETNLEHPFWSWSDRQNLVEMHRWAVQNYDEDRADRAKRKAEGLGPRVIERPAWG